jgi:hypothetical protein
MTLGKNGRGGRSFCQAEATALSSDNYGLRDQSEAKYRAAQPFITDLRLRDLHYGGTVLSAAMAPALSGDPNIKTER